MVIKRLDEEVYKPIEKKPLISLKGYDYFPKDQKSKFKDIFKKDRLSRLGSMQELKIKKRMVRKRRSVFEQRKREFEKDRLDEEMDLEETQEGVKEGNINLGN
jgi:hypothetical protein